MGQLKTHLSSGQRRVAGPEVGQRHGGVLGGVHQDAGRDRGAASVKRNVGNLDCLNSLSKGG